MNQLFKYYHKIWCKLQLELFKQKHKSSNVTIIGTPNIKKLSNIEVGSNSYLEIGSGFTARSNVAIAVRNNAKLTIGSSVFINRNTNIVAHKNIKIADGVTIGPNCCIYDHDHDLHNKGKYLSEDVVIGRNVWIGANVVILKKVTIGENSVISAGCVVTKDVPANAILIQKRANTILEK